MFTCTKCKERVHSEMDVCVKGGRHLEPDEAPTPRRTEQNDDAFLKNLSTNLINGADFNTYVDTTPDTSPSVDFGGGGGFDGGGSSGDF